MKDYYLFTTPRGNRYCFNIARGELLLCHPVLFEIISVHRRGESAAGWYEKQLGNGTEAVECARWNRSEVDYYYRKFRFLKDAGFFTEHDRHAAVSPRLTTEDVARALRTTSSIAFELTEACNLRCIYCCYGECYEASKHRSGRHLSPEVANILLRYLFDSWATPGSESPREVTIAFYGGEPLLRVPAIEQIMQSVRALNEGSRSLRFKMTTNGLLVGRHADFLAEHDIELLISMDGDPKSHSYRVLPDGTDSHSRVLESVKRLMRRHPAYFRRQVNFNAVFNARSSVDRLYAFFKDNFDKIPIISPLSFVGADPEHRHKLEDMDGDLQQSVERSKRRPEIAQAMFTRLPPVSYASIFLVRTYPFQFEQYHELLSDDSNRQWLPTGTCMPFVRGLFVTVDGEILPCERIAHSMVLGQVGPAGVEIDCESIAQRYNACYDQVSQLCEKCHHRRTCPSCMFELDHGRADLRCPSYAAEEEFVEYLVDVFGYLEQERWVVSRTLGEVTVL